MPYATGPRTVTNHVTCDGHTTTVSTTQKAGESLDDFYNRHATAVAAERARCSGTFSEGLAYGTVQVQCTSGGPWSTVSYTQTSGETYAEFADSFEAAIAGSC